MLLSVAAFAADGTGAGTEGGVTTAACITGGGAGGVTTGGLTAGGEPVATTAAVSFTIGDGATGAAAVSFAAGEASDDAVSLSSSSFGGGINPGAGGVEIFVATAGASGVVDEEAGAIDVWAWLTEGADKIGGEGGGGMLSAAPAQAVPAHNTGKAIAKSPNGLILYAIFIDDPLDRPGPTRACTWHKAKRIHDGALKTPQKQGQARR